MIAKGATSFARDVQNGVFKDYSSWPGTEKLWEQGDIPAPSATLPNDRSSLDVPAGNATASGANNAPGNLNFPASLPNSEGMIGLVSGKPMRFPFVPIFETRAPSGTGLPPPNPTASDSQAPLSVNDAYHLYLKRLSDYQSLTPAADASAASPPLAPDRQISLAGGNDPAPSAGRSGASFALPLSAAPASQGPLSLNDAYLEYLRRSGVNPS